MHGFYVNDVYGGAVVSPAKPGAAFLAYVVDDRLIDGSVNGIGGVFRQLARAGATAPDGPGSPLRAAFAAGAVGILIFLAVRSLDAPLPVAHRRHVHAARRRGPARPVPEAQRSTCTACGRSSSRCSTFGLSLGILASFHDGRGRASSSSTTRCG